MKKLKVFQIVIIALFIIFLIFIFRAVNYTKEYTVNNIIASPIEGVILELPVPSTESNLIAFNNAQLYIKEIHDTFIIIGCVNTPSDNIAVSFRNVSSSV